MDNYKDTDGVILMKLDKLLPGPSKWVFFSLWPLLLITLLVLYSVDWTAIYIFTEKPAPVVEEPKAPQPKKKTPPQREVIDLFAAPETVKPKSPKAVKKAPPVTRQVIDLFADLDSAPVAKEPVPKKVVPKTPNADRLLRMLKQVNRKLWGKYQPQNLAEVEQWQQTLMTLSVTDKVPREPEWGDKIVELRAMNDLVKADHAQFIRREKLTKLQKQVTAKITAMQAMNPAKVEATTKTEIQKLLDAAVQLAPDEAENRLFAAATVRLDGLKAYQQKLKTMAKTLRPQSDGFEAAPEQQAFADKWGLPVTVRDRRGIVFRLVPPGTFMMGSPEDESGRNSDEKLHQVTLTKPFYLSIYEISEAHAGRGGNRVRPATKMNFAEVEALIKRWNERESFGPGEGYILPTEAQWEYACRAGSAAPFYGFTQDEVAVTSGFMSGEIKDSGTLKANAWGFYDLLGNVREWCRDRNDTPFIGRRLQETYKQETINDPLGAKGTDVVVRGGSWNSSKDLARAAARDYEHPEVRVWDLGFRLIRQITLTESDLDYRQPLVAE